MNKNKLLKFWIVLVALLLHSMLSLPALADEQTSNSNAEDSFANLVYMPLVLGSTSSRNGIYFLSPNGDDNKSGRSESDAWATFERAFQDLLPGDTLLLMDGAYSQSLDPVFGGEQGNPITIKAQHDGKAILDGEGIRDPIILRRYRGASFFIIEGIIARNGNTLSGNGSVILIESDHNIFRRVSAYDANTDSNSVVIRVTGDYNLVEDCVAYGTGRKMIMTNGEHNTIRRCYADWQSWDGRERSECWPWGDGIDIYNGNFNIVENSISFSRNPTQSFIIRAQGNDERAEGNKILGSMAILSGMNEDGTPMDWGDTRPQPTEYDCMRDFDWEGQRSGFFVWESGAPVRDNLWQDIFAWGNAGIGISWAAGKADPGTDNNRIIRATAYNNGLDNPDHWGGLHTDALQADLDTFNSVENSFIENIYTGSGTTTMNGEGARLTHRYIDGELTGDPLWPWPMESRIQAELGFSVTDLMTNIIFSTSDLSEIYP